MPKEELHKYGCPLYGVAWSGNFAYMCGGGNLGIENKVVVITAQNGVLSEEVTKLNVGKDAPYRMALHPSGRAMALGLTLGGLVRVTIKPGVGHNPPMLACMQGDEADQQRFKPIKSLSFSDDGRSLAIGGEDGSLEVVAWPSLQRIVYWQASENKAIRNVDFSAAHSNGLLATVDESGACKLWDSTSGELCKELKMPADFPRGSFFRCRSVVDDEGIALYTVVKFKSEGYILRWRQDEDGEIRLEARTPKPVTPAPICGFETSHSGRLLAAVTPEGDQCVISAATLKVIKYRKGAHMTFATAVAFTPDDSAILSTSGDASATLTTLRSSAVTGGPGGSTLGVFALLAALLALLMGMLRYYAMQEPELVQEHLRWLPLELQQLLMS